jgi:hypothetical protein
MGKGAGDNYPPHFEKLRVAKLILCNCLNNYDNLNGWSLHSVYIFMKNIPQKSTIFFI